MHTTQSGTFFLIRLGPEIIVCHLPFRVAHEVKQSVTHSGTNRALYCLICEMANHSTSVAIKAGVHSKVVEVVFVPIPVTMDIQVFVKKYD